MRPSVRREAPPLLLLDVPLEHLASDDAAVDVPARVDADAFRARMIAARRLHVFDERGHLPVRVQPADGRGRLDFDVPGSSLDKEAIASGLNALIAEGHSVGPRWITDAELAAQPELVRTMSDETRCVATDTIAAESVGAAHERRAYAAVATSPERPRPDRGGTSAGELAPGGTLEQPEHDDGRQAGPAEGSSEVRTGALGRSVRR